MTASKFTEPPATSSSQARAQLPVERKPLPALSSQSVGAVSPHVGSACAGTAPDENPAPTQFYDGFVEPKSEVWRRA